MGLLCLVCTRADNYQKGKVQCMHAVKVYSCLACSFKRQLGVALLIEPRRSDDNFVAVLCVGQCNKCISIEMLVFD